MRLIDANVLINKLDEMISKAILADTEIHYALIRELVAEQPTIEPEVRHGHWIFQEEATPEYLPWDMWCSCCGEYHDSDDYNDRYCSKCGAKMDAGGTISKERFAEIGGADNG